MDDRAGAARGPRRRDEIFTATLELLAERGYEQLTIEAIAERAEVNKTTLYRWWPSKAALLGAALVEAPQLRFETPDTGSLLGDLIALTETIIALLTTPPACDIAVAALSAAADNPQLAQYGQALFAERLAGEQPVFERAVARGELPAGVDPMLIMDLLAGAAWVRIVLRRTPVEEDFARRAAEIVSAGVRRPRRDGPGQSGPGRHI